MSDILKSESQNHMVLVRMTGEEVSSISDFQLTYELPTRADAVKALIKIGLRMHEKKGS